jgi:hypothetical protein
MVRGSPGPDRVAVENSIIDSAESAGGRFSGSGVRDSGAASEPVLSHPRSPDAISAFGLRRTLARSPSAITLLVMTVLLVLALIGAGIWLTSQRGEKPNELDPDVWSSDPAERAANLAAKAAALKAGKPYASQAQLAQWERARAQPWPSGSVTVVTPPSEPEQRLVRDHPMRPPRWK